MRAAAQGKLEIVRRLLGAGARRNAIDNDGYVALRLALEGGHEDVAAVLREMGK